MSHTKVNTSATTAAEVTKAALAPDVAMSAQQAKSSPAASAQDKGASATVATAQATPTAAATAAAAAPNKASKILLIRRWPNKSPEWQTLANEVATLLTPSIDFNAYFTNKPLGGQEMRTLTMGTCSLPTGKLIVCDPMVDLANTNDKWSTGCILANKLPRGEFPVQLSIIMPGELTTSCVRYAAARLLLSDQPAVAFEPAIPDNCTIQDLQELREAGKCQQAKHQEFQEKQAKRQEAQAQAQVQAAASEQALASSQAVASASAVASSKAVASASAAAFASNDGDEEEDGELIIGFGVDAGMGCFCDLETKKEWAAFCAEQDKDNSDFNCYDHWISDILEESYNDDPELQRSGGDYAVVTVPGTPFNVPIFSSGWGDGFYGVFIGRDQYGDICQVLTHFIDVEYDAAHL